MPPRHRPKVELVTDHVSGEMSTGERNRRLNRLRNIEPGQSAVLTNAGCLSEGIDVPALDGVAFIDPRRSQVDIVQAVGRAIRRSADKTIGTIVIPVFLSDTDDPDTALSESEFEPVWSILRALRSHDDALGEALDEIRFSMGRRGGGGGLPPKIKTDLPKNVSPKFAEAFTTRLVGATSAVWEEWFGRLESYVAESGNARPPADYSDEDGNALGGWVSFQRTHRTKGRLSDERVERLESLPGWSWDPKEDVWNGYFDELVAYVATNGNAAVPTSLVLPDGRRLGMWASGQRTNRTKGQLSDEKAERLESLPGWSWDLKEDEWNGYFGELVAYVEEHGTSRVERRHVTSSGLKLGAWVGGTRSYRSRGKLRADRIKRLEGLPFWTWDAYESDFEDGFAALAAWVDQHGHTRVPAKKKFNGIVLGTWVSKRRSERASGALGQDRIEQLEAIPGWTWDPKAEVIQEWLDALSEYVSEHGHAEVQWDYVNSGGQKLGSWVVHQRVKYREGRLEASISGFVERLPGWVWDPGQEKWEVAFAELEAFAGVEGHSRPKQKHETPGGLQLGTWVANQRQFFKKDKLSPEQVTRLEALPGWVWNTVEANWEEAFALLEAYVAREGHSGVPQGHSESGFGLGVWVNKQRGKYRKGKTPPNKATRLLSLEGWEWEPGNARLSEGLSQGLEALEQFAADHGHARVPREYVTSDGLKLGVWVGNQRAGRSRLSTELRATLEALPGWVWHSNKAAWDEGYERLKSFIERERRLPKGGETDRGFKISQWVTVQRTTYKKGQMPDERIEQLEALPGWVWDVSESQWDASFEALQAYVAEHGHARVPEQFRGDGGLGVGLWVQHQRQLHKKGQLDDTTRAQLEALSGWAWDANEARWNDGYESFLRHVATHGHARPVVKYVDETGHRLGRWVDAQRQAYKNGTLSKERTRRLEVVEGWVWSFA